MHIKKLLGVLVLISFFFTACENKDDMSDIVATSKQSSVKTYKLTQTDGSFLTVEYEKGKWRFKEFPNKVVLLSFWATWCTPCKAEIPHLNNLINKYKDDFIVLGILVEQDKNHDFVNQFIKEHNIQYPVTNGTENFRLAKDVGEVGAIPAMFMYDKTGKQVAHYVGATPEEIIDNDINKYKGNK